MRVLEYGAGTGILSFLLRDKFSEIILMDNSREMIRICKEKVKNLHASNIRPLFYDLENRNYKGKFDLIINHMVLHHIKETDLILRKFLSLLNDGGYLAIADLYSEDGSFHGEDADVHKGFDPEMLSQNLLKMGFKKAEYRTCFKIERDDKIYPLFLLITQK